MRRNIWVLGLVLGMALSAAGQDTPKAEVVGGYSYIRSDGENLHGWNAGIAGNVNSWFGVAADFGGHYFEQMGFKFNAHTFTFGPRFSYRTGRVTPFFHVLPGGARFKSTVGGISVSDTGFALVSGGGLDVKANDSVAIRIIQVDALSVRSGGQWSTDPRLSFGIVFRLGKK